MAWTHRNAPDMLRLYPEMAEMVTLQRAWPSLAKAVAAKRDAESGKPGVEPGTKSDKSSDE